MKNLALFFLLSGMFLPAAANPSFQPLESIRDTVHNYILDSLSDSPLNIEVDVSQPDSRLKLAACSESLTAFMPSGKVRAGNMTVGVRCSGDSPWKIYIPARVKTLGDVVKLARPVTRGHTLTINDLRVEQDDIGALNSGYFEQPSQLLGFQVKRSMRSGQILNRLMVKLPNAIKRGQKVTLLANTAGFEVRVAGKALGDAALGESLRVLNLSSKRVVEGKVTGEKLVTVSL